MTTGPTSRPADALREHAAAVVHRGTDEKTRALLAELFAHEVFAYRDGLTEEEACRLAYERMRLANERLSPATTLLKEDLPRLLALIEQAAAVSPALCFAMLVHYLLCTACVVELGAECDLAAERAELDSMSAIGVFMTTEVGRGSSHVNPCTEATYDPERHDFVLHTPVPAATKLMPNVALPGVPKVGVATARLMVDGVDRGVFGFFVPLRDEHGVRSGVHIQRLPELPALRLDHALVTFDRVRLPFRYWLRDGASIDGDGTFTDPSGGGDARLVRTMRVGSNVWAAQAAACASVSRASVATAIRFAHRRTTAARLAPGEPVLRYRSHQRALFGALAATYAITCLAGEIRTTAAPGPAHDHEVTWAPWATVNRTAAVAKALAAITAGRVVRESRERCGALGLLSSSGFTAHEGLAQAFFPAGGDSTLILLDAARTLTSDVDSSRPAAVTGPLGEREAWPTLLRGREVVLAAELAEELRRAERRGQDQFERWNNRLDVARDLAEAHGTRLALESFLAAVDTVGQLRAREVLLSLCAVHALTEISRHEGWYLRAGLLTDTQIQRIPQLLNMFCEQLAPHAHALVDAFELPAPADDVPIAAEDYIAAVLARAGDGTGEPTTRPDHVGA